MVPTRKKLARVFVDVIYKYDVDAQVFNEIIAHTDDNKIRGNKQWHHMIIFKIYYFSLLMIYIYY